MDRQWNPVVWCCAAALVAMGCGDGGGTGSIRDSGPRDSGARDGGPSDGGFLDSGPSCGNGRVEGSETCDTAIASGEVGACPTDCVDAVACTADESVGAGCDLVCMHTPITSCNDDDGCCPSECSAAEDNDCPSACTQLYWSDVSTHAISRINIDGTGEQVVVNGPTAGSSRLMVLAIDAAAGHLYWTQGEDVDQVEIRRGNLDGSSPQTLVSGLGCVEGLALAAGAGKMYWTDACNNRIQRANLDGSMVETVVTDQNFPHYLVVDSAAGEIYWIEQITGTVRRANLDGTGIEESLITTEANPVALALDPTDGKVYWSAGTPERDIYRANLDGSAPEMIVDLAARGANGLAVDRMAAKLYWTFNDIDNIADAIQHSNTDGTESAVLVATGSQPHDVQLYCP